LLGDGAIAPAANWTQIGWGPFHCPSGGVADSLDEAKAAFRAAGE